MKFVLPLGAGSGADLGARLLAEKLSARWGQPVVVENRPGGDGFVAITGFISANDDHILFLGPASSFTAHPYLHDKLPYKMSDLSPVARVSATVVTLNAPPSMNAKSWADVARRGEGATRQAELGHHHRRDRSDLRRLAQESRPRHGQGPYRNPVAH